MKTTLSAHALGPIFDRLARANGQARPGESDRRQPVHTVYGGAHLFRAGTAAKIGELASKSLDTYAPDEHAFAAAFGISPALAPTVRARVKEKLAREAVEDFRVDFEDGFGIRPDGEEDEACVASAREMGSGLRAGTLPPFVGIRVKSLSEELKDRALRTLDLFLSTLLAETGGRLPDNFVVTLPKITHELQVAALAEACTALERPLGLSAGTIAIELMVETPESLFDAEGACPLPRLVRAAGGRCVAAHLGAYDYTASLGIAASRQALDHPACDFARHMMKASLAQTGTWLVDGATNVMPIAPHKQPRDTREAEENRVAVLGAWRLSYAQVQRSLAEGFYQGWDLHPAQLPARYAALYTFFLEGLAPAAVRLRNFLEQATKASLVGNVFDDAATGQGLLNFFLRGLGCGALSEDDVKATGLSREELALRSFKKILEKRAGAKYF